MSNGTIADLKNILMEIQGSNVLLPWHVFGPGAALEIEGLGWSAADTDLFERTPGTQRTKFIRRLRTPSDRANKDAQALASLLQDFFAKATHFLFDQALNRQGVLSKDDIIVFFDMPREAFPLRSNAASDDILFSYNEEALANTKTKKHLNLVMAKIFVTGGSKGEMIPGNKNRI